MDLLKRDLQAEVEKMLFYGKAIVVVGARQVGKSTLFSQILEQRPESVLRLDCDQTEVREMLTSMNTEELKSLIGNNKIVVIDEAQRVPEIGMTLKRITDGFPAVQLLVTGSSSLQLQGRIDEPLTGRKLEYHLYPISTHEILANKGLLAVKQTLESRLIFGSYPDVINHADNAKLLLMNLAQSYLYRDLFAYEGIRKPVLLDKLLVALALQVGSEVSYNEVAQTIGTDSKTVEKYIDLLEKSYIVFRLPALSRNLRNELKRSKKIYFYDNGIRNAVLQNFAPLALRNDCGALWENFFISERVKYINNTGHFAKMYFWRTLQRQEIDYIEEEDGMFSAFEMKWNPKKAAAKIPQAFLNGYPVKDTAVITPENYMNYLV